MSIRPFTGAELAAMNDGFAKIATVFDRITVSPIPKAIAALTKEMDHQLIEAGVQNEAQRTSVIDRFINMVLEDTKVEI